MAVKEKQGNGNSEKEQMLANEVVDQYVSAKSDKESKGLHSDWATYDDYWRGKQNEPLDEDDPGSVTNIVHPLIESQVADLVDDNLEITAEPYDVSGADHKLEVERFLQWIIKCNNFTEKMDRGERWRLKYGTVWSHVTFDPMENYPYGMVKLGFENPSCVFPDPKVKAPHLIDDAEFIILEIVKPLSWFKHNFPDKGEYVRADTGGSGGEIFKDEGNTAPLNYGTNKARLLIRYSWSDDGYLRCVKIGGEDSRVVLYDSDEDEQLQNPDGSHKPWLKLKKYPLRPLVCYPNEGQIWGMGDIELVKPVQDLINDLDDQIRMNARQMAWLIWFVSASSGVNIRQLNTRAAGTVVPVRGTLPPASAIHAFQPREVPRYVIERRETAKQEAERVTARPEVNLGFRPEGVDTYGGLALLQQQGAKKSDHKRTMLYAHLSEVFEIALQISMQMFTETMGVPYDDPDGETQFMPFNPSELSEIPRYFYDPVAEEWQPLDEDGDPMTQEGKWRIQIKAAQGMPKDNMTQYGNLLALMQSGASQLLFEGLSSEDLHRVRKQIFAMIGVKISDEPMQMEMPQGAPQEMMPEMPLQEMPVQAPMQEEQVEPPGRGIPTELQAVLEGIDPAEAESAFASLPPEVQQALQAYFGGGV